MHNVQPQQKILKYLALFFAISTYFLFATVANAATLSVSPSTGVYTTGGTFTARVVVNTSGESVNAAEGSLTFDPQKLSVIGISKGSIFGLWAVEPAFSNTQGTITFGGGTPTGYKGSAGTVVSVTFRAKSAGATKVSFKNGSILAADGKGTNVLTSMGSGAFTIAAAEVVAEPEVIEYIAQANTPAAPAVSSNTHTDPAGWYTRTSAELSWNIPSDVIAVRTLLDDISGSIPTKVYDTPIKNISIDELDEGIQYFHIQFKNAEGWGRVTHYRLAVDTANPTDFDILPAPNQDFSNPEQEFILEVTDEMSGIKEYSVQVDGGDPYVFTPETASSTLTLNPLDPGHHTLVIEAFDYAGNSLIATHSFNILAFDKPKFTEYPNQINEEVIPVIKGITRPLSEVTVILARQGGGVEPQEYSLVSDDSGVFTFIPTGTLSSGVYVLTAIAIDQYGAKSEESDPVRIAVQQPGYVQIGSFVVSVLSVVVPLVALALLLFFMVVYFIRRVRTIRSVVTRETDEALEILEKEFNSVRKLIEAQKKLLEKSRKTKKLTKAEASMTEAILSELKKSQTRIRTEISEVDDIVE